MLLDLGTHRSNTLDSSTSININLIKWTRYQPDMTDPPVATDCQLNFEYHSKHLCIVVPYLSMFAISSYSNVILTGGAPLFSVLRCSFIAVSLYVSAEIVAHNFHGSEVMCSYTSSLRFLPHFCQSFSFRQ